MLETSDCWHSFAVNFYRIPLIKDVASIMEMEGNQFSVGHQTQEVVWCSGRGIPLHTRPGDAPVQKFYLIF